MSGIEFNEDMTTEQLSAFSGGEILKSEVYNLWIISFEKSVIKKN